MARFFRPDFDIRREFKVCRPFTFAARGFLVGMPITKQNFTPRRLRQLYDRRYVDFDDREVETPVQLVSDKPVEVVPEVARREGLNAPQLGFGLVPKKIERKRLRPHT